MNLSILANELQNRVTGQVLTGVPLKAYTTWCVGGPADLLCIPLSEDDVLAALDFAAGHSLPVTVIGNGSDLLVGDGGIRGLTLRLGGGLNFLLVEGRLLKAGSGLLLPGLARIAQRECLSGLEFAVGIPASLGGAVIMNAGARGQQMSNLVERVDTVDMTGHREVWDRQRLAFDYRTSALQGCSLIVLQVLLKLTPADHHIITSRMEDNIQSRRSNQPLDFPTAGSVFRNPPGNSAGRLIEMSGLKGVTEGDAQVSPLHANFIVNRGNATAREIITLMEMIREQVRQQFDIELVPEVKLVGEER
jgi:UDP-N-acetylmuramate dehydrogenase